MAHPNFRKHPKPIGPPPELPYALEGYIAAKALLDRIAPVVAAREAELHQLMGNHSVNLTETDLMPTDPDEQAVWLLIHCARILCE